MKRVKVGLTGGYASGKSVASKFFEELGAYIIDLDEVSKREGLLTDNAKEAIAETFGEDIFIAGDKLDRAKLQQMIFDSDQKRVKLESILHPLIIEAAYKERAQVKDKIVIIVAALIIESGIVDDLDILIAVIADKNLRAARGAKRDGITTDFARRIDDTQSTDQVRIESADYILYNNGSLDDLRAEVAQVWDEISNLP
ncbi:MAG: dephospho-CoA kinase [Nitrospinota bacterium]